MWRVLLALWSRDRNTQAKRRPFTVDDQYDLAVAGISWLFGHRSVTPFAVVQVQPVTVPVGPATTDPLTYPAHWLLEPPGEFQEGWARLFVSTDLAWWHDGWVLGLALVLLAAAFPGGAVRRILLATGLLTSVVCAAAQVWVIP